MKKVVCFFLTVYLLILSSCDTIQFNGNIAEDLTNATTCKVHFITGENPYEYVYHIPFGKTYTDLPVVSAKGKTFTGWFAGMNPTDLEYTQIETNTPETNIYAHWVTIAYTITYECNGGTNNASNPSSYTVDDSVSLLTPTYSPNYFAGWYTTSTFDEGTQITGWAEDTLAEDLTLYAKWLTQSVLSITISTFNGEITLKSDSSTATVTDVSSGYTIQMVIEEDSSGDSYIGDALLTSSKMTLYQGGSPTTYTSATNGTVAPSITLPTWLPADTYQLYLEIVYSGISYSGYITFTVTE